MRPEHFCALAALCYLAACNDPSDDFSLPAEQPPAQQGPQIGGFPADQGDGSGESGLCSPTPISSEAWQLEAGKGVEISGVLTFDDYSSGQVLLEVLSPADQDSPRVLYHLVCRDIGPFKAELPPGFDQVVLVAYIDENGDGPSKGEPAGRTEKPIELKGSSLEGIEIPIQSSPDLGPYSVEKIAPPVPRPADANLSGPVDGPISTGGEGEPAGSGNTPPVAEDEPPQPGSGAAPPTELPGAQSDEPPLPDDAGTAQNPGE